MKSIVRKVDKTRAEVDKTRAEWTTRKAVEFLENNTLILDNAVQKGLVWDKDRNRMSEFILSLIYERPIPPIYVEKIDGVYSVMDGKQQMTTIKQFMNDEFALDGLEPIEILDSETNEIEEVNVNELYFSELDECLQNAIKDATLTVIIINNPTDDEICEYFYCLNNGMSLSNDNSKSKSKI